MHAEESIATPRPESGAETRSPRTSPCLPGAAFTSIERAIAAIGEDAWRQIGYPTGVLDPDTGDLIYDAEVAVIGYTAFTGRPKAEQVTARLIVRRVRDLAKPATIGEQGELFPAWQYHPFFTDSPFEMLQAERQHRHHAVIEQVIADGKAGPLTHLPSGDFNANAAWLVLWAMSFNLLRAAGTLASAFHAKATTATLRAHLISVGGHRLTGALGCWSASTCAPANWPSITATSPRGGRCRCIVWSPRRACDGRCRSRSSSARTCSGRISPRSAGTR